jgi:dTDP-4-dehydrorhamnose 3,5-epimerase
MKFNATPIAGAYTIDLERKGDDRGFFARFFCVDEFAAVGLETAYVQINTSLSIPKGTLRGLHYQLPPAAEVKVVRCISGSLWDVIVDLRPDSPSYGKWFGAELNDDNRTMMYVPRGCAHGFITLSDNAEALYLVSDKYDPKSERGMRFDDPWHGIQWPAKAAEMSAKDQNWPLFDPEFHSVENMKGLVR